MNDCPTPFNVFRDDYRLAGVTRDCSDGGKSNGIFRRPAINVALALVPAAPVLPEKDFGITLVSFTFLATHEWNTVLAEDSCNISFTVWFRESFDCFFKIFHQTFWNR